ncbi:MAG TPA: fibronectin type III domain-containing protein [Pseudobdellovibrionaceae bacterium]|nr:fibronectin type III domain-containing protein [Pseudobdellovibrionaceae bacterium]
MKKLEFLLVLFATLTLSSASFAAGGEHDAHGGEAAHRDNTALFPQPKADPSKASPPAAAQLLEPSFKAAIAGDSVTLKWAAVPSADVYHVQVATDSNFKWLKTDDHTVKGTELKVDGLEKGKLYFWRVAAWKNSNMAATNKGAFSSSSFETK